MLSRLLKFSLFGFLFSGLFFTSCEDQIIEEPLMEEEAIEEITTNEIVDIMDDGTVALFAPSEIETEDIEGPTPKSGGKWRRRLARCFNLVFPLTVELPDETTVVAEDLAMLKRIAYRWRKANPDSEERPRILFPYRVQLPNDEFILIEDLMDLASVVYRCTDRFRLPYPRLVCYRLIFPVTVIFPDGTEKEVDGEEAFRLAVHRWLFGHPRDGDKIEIKYPFSIALNDETTITVENFEKLKEVIEKCREFVAENRCFQVVFPATVEFPGGRKLRVETRERFVEVVNLWMEENPNARKRPRIVFPFTVEFEDGTTAILKNRLDYLRAVRSCRGEKE
jgi:hypothetical protein